MGFKVFYAHNYVQMVFAATLRGVIFWHGTLIWCSWWRLREKTLNGFCLQFCLSHINVLYLSGCYSYFILRCCYFSSYFTSTVTHKKILLQWNVGSWRIKMRLFQYQCQQDLSCLCWSDAGHCWSFLQESPKILNFILTKSFSNTKVEVWSHM